MLSRLYRFHSRGGVRYTYQHGKTIRDSKISLVFASNARKKQRYAVVVSKKVLKAAVGRNKIRRRVYEAIRLELPKIQQPVDCIFIVYTKEIATIEFKELRNLIHNLLIEAKII
ncbi:MAG: ribonuclease P protein component [Candidatus Saccharibacteria bacterium]|nr:ribonuclease P protein component [Candidatus Saccharibacteria bacterium]